MNRILLSLFGLLVCLFTYADAEDTGKVYGSITYSNYHASTITTFGLGSKSKAGEVYDVAYYLPPSLAGNVLTHIRFLLIPGSEVSEVKAWVSTSLPQSADSANVCVVDVDAQQISDTEYIVVPICMKYSIPSEGCYVGYSFTVDSLTEQGFYPVRTDVIPPICDGFYFKTSTVQTDWYDTKAEGSVRNSSIGAVVEGEFYNNAAKFYDSTFGEHMIALSNDSIFRIPVTGCGIQMAKKWTFTVRDESTGEVAEYEEYTGGIDWGEPTVLRVPLKAADKPGRHNVTVTITKVNGVPNDCPENASITGTVLTLLRKAKRMVVEEDYTATGCGWCPMGIEDMRYDSENFGDNWIGISAHAYGMEYMDPMYCSDYEELMPSALPQSVVNRYVTLDPYCSFTGTGYRDVINYFLGRHVEADMTVTAEWDASQASVINVTSDVEFLLDRDDAPYAVGFVLTADGLSGEGNLWAQKNYLSGNTALLEQFPTLESWVNGSAYVEDMVYNNVAIRAVGIESGIEGTIQAPILMGAHQRYSCGMNFSRVSSTTGEDIINDDTQLTAVAILFNTETGEIVNAAKCSVPKNTSGISSVKSDGASSSEIQWFTLEGRRVASPVKGINIKRTSDGTTTKVLVD